MLEKVPKLVVAEQELQFRFLLNQKQALRKYFDDVLVFLPNYFV